MATKKDFSKWVHDEGSSDSSIRLAMCTADARSRDPELAIEVELVFGWGAEGSIKYKAKMLSDDDTLHIAELALALLVERPLARYMIKDYPFVKAALEAAKAAEAVKVA
jgi:hypothetical protein